MIALLLFLFHLNFANLRGWPIKPSRVKRGWDACEILACGGLCRCGWGCPCTRTIHLTLIHHVLFFAQLCQGKSSIVLLRCEIIDLVLWRRCVHEWIVITRLRLNRTTENNHRLSFNSFKRTSMDNARLRFWLLTNFLLRHLELLRLLVTCKNLGGFFNPFLVFAVIDQESFDLNTNRYPWHMPGISADIRGCCIPGICHGYMPISSGPCHGYKCTMQFVLQCYFFEFGCLIWMVYKCTQMQAKGKVDEWGHNFSRRPHSLCDVCNWGVAIRLFTP